MDDEVTYNQSGSEMENMVDDSSGIMGVPFSYAYNETLEMPQNEDMDIGDAISESTCLISLDSLKYQDYRLSEDRHVIRLTQKEVNVDAVIFHQRSLQINFRCLSSEDPLFSKYHVPENIQFIWHAELAGEIVPEECEMRSRGREFVLKKRDPSEWNSSLLQCNSTSTIPSYSSSRSYTSPRSVSYVYSNALPPSESRNFGQAPNYYRFYTNTSRPSYSTHAYAQSTPRYSTSNYSPTARSRSTSSISSRSSISPVTPSTSIAPSHSVSTAVPEDPSLPPYSSLRSSATSLSANIVRPTAKVPPYEERGTLADPGFTGLRNIGNTCFMNATLQMLVNCKELQIFFTGDHYRTDINVSNPLGFGGRLANVFAEFMKQMWNGLNRTYEPATVKELVAEKAPQFANFAQHDAHEFLSFLLDGLHEDLNRVRAKPYTSTVEAAGRPDIEVSKEAWKNHLLRNDSIFVDLFHGQLKSRLQCPKCSRVSVTFDPFVYLAVPFPKEKRSADVYFWPAEPRLKPFMLSIRYNADGSASEMLSAVSQLVKVNENLLRLVEVDNRCFAKVYKPNDNINGINTSTILFVFQVLDPVKCEEEVLELYVVQRLLFRKSLTRACANCHSTDEKLKSCERCYDVFYCKRECQCEHWIKEHKQRCRNRPQPDTVGHPFIISLPKSKATFANILRNLELRCRYSVNVFQPPIDSDSQSTDNNSNGAEDNNGNLEAENGSLPKIKDNLYSTESFNGNTFTGRKLDNMGKKPFTMLGESRNKHHPDSLFLIRKMESPNSVIGENLTDSHDDPIDLPSTANLSINWYNMKFGKDYLTVESKDELEMDTEKTTYFKNLSFDIVNNRSSASNPTLYDMLSVFSETERLKSEESWYCNKCKEHVEATKKLVLYRLPPILIVQLKRFVYTTSVFSMHRRSKDERPVTYPLNDLDLSDFLCETAPEGQNTKYDLTGVVCHSGSSYFGHYISIGRLASLDGKSTEIDWRIFDDSIVTRTQASRVQSNDAYLLFYKQRGATTKQLLTKRYGI